MKHHTGSGQGKTIHFKQTKVSFCTGRLKDNCSSANEPGTKTRIAKTKARPATTTINQNHPLLSTNTWIGERKSG